MKRLLALLFILIVCAAGYLYIWGYLPFVPAIGPGMALEIRSASLPMIIFVVIAIVLLAIFLYSNDIIIGFRGRYRASISPVVEENQRVSLVLSNRFEGTEKALESFASAMQEYAHHMASHTSAIQGLSEASQALKNSAAEQNQILYRLSHNLRADKSVTEVSVVERVVSELEKRTQLVLRVKDELEGKVPAPEVAPRREIPLKVSAPEVAPRREVPLIVPAPEVAPRREVPSKAIVQSPPGCLVNPKALYARMHLSARHS